MYSIFHNIFKKIFKISLFFSMLSKIENDVMIYKKPKGVKG